MERCGQRIARFGVNFAVIAADGRIAVQVNGGAFESKTEPLLDAGRSVLSRVAEQRHDGGDIPVWQCGDDSLFLAAPLMLPPVAAGYRDPLGAAVIETYFRTKRA